MSFFRSLFTRNLPDMAPENPTSFKIHMNFSKAKETKIELDKKHADLSAAEILRVIQLPDKCLVVETFSKANGKVIGRRKIADFERPFSSAEFGGHPERDDLKFKVWLVDPEDTKILSTSQIINNRFRAQTARIDSAEQELRVEKDATFLLKHDLNSPEERKVHLFLTSQMIYFKYSHDKQRVTHIPLLLIDEIIREDASKLIFSIASAGVHYFFLGASADMVRQWTSAIQDSRQKAQVRMAVQGAEQEIKASAVRQASLMLSLRNLTKEDIMANRDFRESLYHYLRSRGSLPTVIAENISLLFDFFSAYDRGDSTDMRKIEGLLDAKGFFQGFGELETLRRSTDRSFNRESVGSAHEGEVPVGQFWEAREKVEWILAKQFEMEGFLEFYFEGQGTLRPRAAASI